MSSFLRNRERRTRTGLKAAAAVAILALAPASAQAATDEQGAQVITGAPTFSLDATFPVAYSFGTFAVGPGGNSSTEQTVNVKSNAAWGVKVSTDEASGFMRRHDGSFYVAGQLNNALQWANTSYDGTPVGSPVYANLGSTQALVVGSKPGTADAGKDVGVSYKQLVSYSDDANLGTDTYRITVTYDATQGF